MKFLTLSAILVVSLLTSCSHEPGEYCCFGRQYNQVDIPLEKAWQRSIEVLNSRWEIVSNNTVDRTLTVKTFYHEVDVEFIPLTENTCEFYVSSRTAFVKPNEAAVKCIYLELERALKELEN